MRSPNGAERGETEIEGGSGNLGKEIKASPEQSIRETNYLKRHNFFSSSSSRQSMLVCSLYVHFELILGHSLNHGWTQDIMSHYHTRAAAREVVRKETRDFSESLTRSNTT